MFVARVEHEIVLHDDGGDPDVVRRNGRPLTPELPIKIGVMKSRLVVGEENLDVVFQQKPPQGSFTFGLPPAAGESGSRARSRNAASSAGGMPRIVYCTHEL